eukprot:1143475_1
MGVSLVSMTNPTNATQIEQDGFGKMDLRMTFHSLGREVNQMTMPAQKIVSLYLDLIIRTLFFRVNGPMPCESDGPYSYPSYFLCNDPQTRDPTHPTTVPTNIPTINPSMPTTQPTEPPSTETDVPSQGPTNNPSHKPSVQPTKHPSQNPSTHPSNNPSN